MKSMRIGNRAKPASQSRPFNAARHLRSMAEVAAYIEAMLEDGDARAVPVALRTVAEFEREARDRDQRARTG